MDKAESPTGRTYVLPEAPQLLENGKAVHGVPGPGAYIAPSSFSGKKRHDGDAGRQIYTTPPSWTLKGRIDDIERSKSPGPVYDSSHGLDYLEKPSMRHGLHNEGTFGVGSRDEPHRFYSSQHSQATLLCTASPGPAAYKQKEGRHIPHTLGDAPTWQFGARLKGAWDRPNNFSPGPVYEAGTSLGKASLPVFHKSPRFSFGPTGARQRGMQQSKSQALKVLWSRTERGEETKDAPGPGFYQAESASEALAKQAAAYSFSAAKSGRGELVQEDTVMSAINLPGSFKTPCTRFAPPPRCRSVPLPSDNRAETPDYNTQLEMSARAARQEHRPGPGQYDVVSHAAALSGHPKAPAPGFGSEQRQCNKEHKSELSLPGPGTYKAEDGTDHSSRHPVAPAFSLSPTWQPPRPTSARPGPGAYRLLTDQELEQCSSQHAYLGSATLKGRSTTRYSFIPKSDSPGPIYNTSSSEGKRRITAPVFGDRTAPPQPAHTQTVPDFFTGALHTLGRDSPGPNVNIQGRPSKHGPGTPWGKWKHGVKLPPKVSPSASISRESSVDSKAASPGPCYNPQVSLLNSKHSHGGSFSFGVGGRAPFYTVKF